MWSSVSNAEDKSSKVIRIGLLSSRDVVCGSMWECLKMCESVW